MNNICRTIMPTALLLAISLAVPWNLNAQNIEFAPHVGYMLGGNFRGYEGEVKIGDGLNYGFTLDFEMAPGTQFEFMYNRLDSDLKLRAYNRSGDEHLFDLSTQYFQVGALREGSDGNVRPFGTFTMGTTVFDPKSPEYNSLWRFSIGLGGGVKAFVSDRIGIRLGARLLMPVYFSGGGLWCGTGGCSVGIGTGTAIAQGDFTGGLIFRLGN
jgi:hypothetical protein